MITPLFRLSQDNEFITLTAKLKYVKFSDFDYFIDNNTFRFSLKPYFLKITLSHPLSADSPKNQFVYNIEEQILICKIQKAEIGAHFENLDLISTLFDNPTTPSAPIANKIEEVSTNSNNSTLCKINVQNANELNEYLFNIYSQPEISNLTLLDSKENFFYGFNNQFSDVFDKRAEDAVEICDLNPKKVPLKFRYLAMLEKENNDFNKERYVYDLYLDGDNEDFADDNFKNILSLSNEKFIDSIKRKENEMPYTEKEMQILTSINKTKISFIESNTFSPFKFYLQIVDILFAYLYDCLMTEYEHSSESGWTINKLSSVLSCFVDYDKNFYSQSKEISFSILDELIKHTLIAAYRRVLTYPLYRNVKLCEKIKKEICDVLSLGRFSIVKCFLQIRMIFERSEPRYLLNVLYIDPFLKWIQFDSEDKILIMLAEKIKSTTIELSDIKMNLETAEKEILENDDIEMNDK